MRVLPIPLNRWDTHQTIFSNEPAAPRPAQLPSEHPTRSFWTDSAPNVNPLASEGSEGILTSEADVCIIGSGITGVGVAYHLAESVAGVDHEGPLKVVILEARDFCSGATGRNGGHLTPAAFFDFKRHVTEYGTDEAIRSLALEAHTASSLVSIINAHGLEEKVDLVEGGHIDLLITEKEVEDARDDYEAAEKAGVDLRNVQWMSKEEMQAYGTLYPAVRIPGHNVWPLKLVTQLYHLAQARAGPKFSLSLHTRTPVTAISNGGVTIGDSNNARPYIVETPRGSISCSRVVHATNGYASHLLPFLTGPEGIVPTRGQIIAVRAAASTQDIGKNGWGGNEGFEYWFPRPVRRSENASTSDEQPLIILGGGREVVTEPPFELYVDDDSTNNHDAGRVLRDFLPAVFDGRFEAGREPEMEWTGIMAFTKSGDPFVGPVLDPSGRDSGAYKGQYIAAGYTGHGMPRAFGCAEVVAEMIIAELSRKQWSTPEWLPEGFLTWNRIRK
ncbi:hypothetical protein SERLA73DRAFT_185222 [Serpula lacrymans var. lacrymans S7.3]|uniref:FAD dependent oxidoreductase domain-containing protein n=2 Tax=Serpula lacrymans var. lacrymans TaxID=341189 RepID=F8Q4A8_SERL3|nr:uncharacterized protein SERLADRAFT_473549 [Serpula lacrymans var. lacrymans S7.9]EGN96963.1 hypothetical protein SERLA73DRAFT_185222 [Serpula lacrymans var. lacrymans S7.3]EGO22558.1 hypothetical protein SERLADRAFT_473549 [Serpula lacrymans var. lacrymans S7.9]